jgi:D-alanyl-lipoteichoic acid acyltransferase DltB (MBOAT superfamily)
LEVLLAAYAFAFQIYGDFAGYSNIARGLGKLMGFELMINFHSPYLSSNPVEFWRRWHISLSSWLRDYLYIPLGGNRKGTLFTYRNLAITMFLGGLWHGAAWTYILWGFYQAMLLIVHRLFAAAFEKFSLPQKIFGKKLWRAIKIVIFFQFICLGWIIFRAQSVTQAGLMLASITGGLNNRFFGQIVSMTCALIGYGWIAWCVHILQYRYNDTLALYHAKIGYKVLVYVVCFYLLILYGASSGKEFIYFQF